jgi:hypothetical protein
MSSTNAAAPLSAASRTPRRIKNTVFRLMSSRSVTTHTVSAAAINGTTNIKKVIHQRLIATTHTAPPPHRQAKQ